MTCPGVPSRVMVDPDIVAGPLIIEKATDKPLEALALIPNGASVVNLLDSELKVIV